MMQAKSDQTTEKPPRQREQMERYVLARLRGAGITLLAIKDFWSSVPQDFAGRWRPVATAMIALGQISRATWPEPSQDQVSRMVEGLSWLDDLPQVDKRIVSCLVIRARGATEPIVGLEALARSTGLNHAEVLWRFDRAISLIAARLEAEKLAAD